MRILFLSCCIFALSFVPTMAQVGYGVKGGGELTHLWDSDFNISGPKLGLMGGIFVKFRFLSIFAIQPEILYVAKGGEYPHKETGTIKSVNSPDPSGDLVIPLTITKITDFTNVEVPLLFKLYAPGFIAASPHLLVGPFYGYMVDSRKITYSVSGVDGTTPINASNLHVQAELDYLEDKYGKKDGTVDNQHEIGLVIGGGVDFSLGTFDIRYSIGFTGIEEAPAPGNELDKSHTGTLTVMVGFEL